MLKKVIGRTNKQIADKSTGSDQVNHQLSEAASAAGKAKKQCILQLWSILNTYNKKEYAVKPLEVKRFATLINVICSYSNFRGKVKATWGAVKEIKVLSWFDPVIGRIG